MASTFLNLSTDTTLGGNSPSDSVAVSQKAIKTYVDNNSGGGSIYTAGTGIDITNYVISVTIPTLTNTATGTNSITIGGTASASNNNVNIGTLSWINGQQYENVAIGYGAHCSGTVGYTYTNCVAIGAYAGAEGLHSIALGSSASATGKSSIQLGMGTNSTDSTLQIGFYNQSTPAQPLNYTLLDGTTGLIPSARIAIDGTSITVNSSGQLQASGGGASVEAFTAAEVQTIWESV